MENDNNKENLTKRRSNCSFWKIHLGQLFNNEDLPFATRLLAHSLVKLKNFKSARSLYIFINEIFPFLWSNIEEFFNTFSSSELIKIKNCKNSLIEVYYKDTKQCSNCPTIANTSENKPLESLKNLSNIDKPITRSNKLNKNHSKNLKRQNNKNEKFENENFENCLPNFQILLKLLFEAFEQFEIFNFEKSIKICNNSKINNCRLSIKLCGQNAYKLQNYESALDYFEKYHWTFPYLLDCLHYHSSTCWLLRRHKHLTFLARDAKELNSNSPFTWISIGNLLSLEKRKNQAIEALRRAIQLCINTNTFPDINTNNVLISIDSKTENSKILAYALSLLGHELMELDEIEGALKCYSHAIIASPKSYQAYYGIGSIYMQKEDYKLAEKYFKYTVCLNPKSAMVQCNLAQAQVNSGNAKQAVKTLSRAIKIDPDNMQYKFYLARVLFLVGEYQNSLFYAEQVKIVAAQEPSIYDLLSKIYLKLNKKAMAMTCAHLANAYGKGINDQDNLQKSEESNSNDKEMDNDSGKTDSFVRQQLFKNEEPKIPMSLFSVIPPRNDYSPSEQIEDANLVPNWLRNEIEESSDEVEFDGNF